VQEDNYYRERKARDQLTSASSCSPLLNRRIDNQLATVSAATDQRSFYPVSPRMTSHRSETRAVFENTYAVADKPHTGTPASACEHVKSGPSVMIFTDNRLTVRRSESQEAYVARSIIATRDIPAAGRSSLMGRKY